MKKMKKKPNTTTTTTKQKDGKRRNKNKLDSNSLPDYGVEEWRDGAGKYLIFI